MWASSSSYNAILQKKSFCSLQCMCVCGSHYTYLPCLAFRFLKSSACKLFCFFLSSKLLTDLEKKEKEKIRTTTKWVTRCKRYQVLVLKFRLPFLLNWSLEISAIKEFDKYSTRDIRTLYEFIKLWIVMLTEHCW